MSLAYLYPPDSTDFSTIGVCGALMATVGTCEMIANGMIRVTMEHQIDRYGKYSYLQTGMILKVEIPVRTTPEIANGAFVTQVETYTVKSTATKAQRYVYSKASGGKKKKLLSVGTKVTVTSRPASGRWKIKTGKTTGYMDGEALSYQTSETIPDSATGIEQTAPSYERREQLFIIDDVNKADDRITVSAIHISYQLMYNLTTYDTSAQASLQAVLDGILNNCLGEHDFHAYTNIAGTHAGAHYADQDPISAMLNPDTGLAALWGAEIVRDNWDIYLLDRAGANRGFRVEPAKNLVGISYSESSADVATRIRPVGETKSGKKLYLTDNDGCVDSEIRSSYPFDRIKILNCEDCKVGTNGVNESIARARMREQARAEFAAGADIPTINIQVEYANLGNSSRYARYRDLENAFLYDEITVRHPRLGINIQVDITRIVWDWVNDRMQSTECGQLAALAPSVSGWQITGGISGRKMIDGTIGSNQLGEDIIDARHLQSESVNTRALAAGSVTTAQLAAGAVTAETIAAGTIAAGMLTAINAVIETIQSGTGTFTNLNAAFARLQVLTAGSAEFDRATVAHLVADALHLTFGVGEDVFIENMRVLYAQMADATIGNLCIRASDGNYYAIDVSADGTVTATSATVSEGELDAGQTSAGRTILETDITADSLSAGNLLGTYALINKIDAARLDVDTLLARQAFVDALYAGKIFGGQSMQEITQNIGRWMDLNDPRGFVIRAYDIETQQPLGQWENILSDEAYILNHRSYGAVFTAKKDIVTPMKLAFEKNHKSIIMKSDGRGGVVWVRG